ncbi:MAG: hypothetical protein LBU27_06355 [Candidatus Peribacteria bacterium]|nr:hypothetical protein [Candidatus Peribacteria bacterium]
MKEVRKIIKVEKNEPTDYIKTENPNDPAGDNQEELTTEEKEILELYRNLKK